VALSFLRRNIYKLEFFFLFPAGVILPVILRLYLVEPSKANVKQARQIVHQRCTLIFIPSVLSILYFLTAFAHVKFIFDNTEFIFWFLSIAALTISCGTFLNQIAVDSLFYFAWAVIFDVALYTGINIMVLLANDSSAPLSSVTLETGIYYLIWILIAVIIVTYGDFGGTQLRADKSVGLTVASKGNEATEFAGVSKNAPANLAAVKPQDRLAASALCACLVGVLWFISLFSSSYGVHPLIPFSKGGGALNNLSCVTLQFKSGATIPTEIRGEDDNVSIPVMIVSESTEAFWIAAYSTDAFTLPKNWDNLPEIFAIERSQVTSIIVYNRGNGKNNPPGESVARESASTAKRCSPQSAKMRSV
jgi:hypothetical protein